VESAALSPTAVHRRIDRSEPSAIVFPVVHTLYDYNERI